MSEKEPTTVSAAFPIPSPLTDGGIIVRARNTIKDYVDMVAHIENNEKTRVVVNFAPVLLEQIDDYAQQLEGYLHHGKALRDPLLSALADPVLPHDSESRIHIIKACLRANKERLVDRFDAFKTLTEMAETALQNPERLT